MICRQLCQASVIGCCNSTIFQDYESSRQKEVSRLRELQEADNESRQKEVSRLRELQEAMLNIGDSALFDALCDQFSKILNDFEPHDVEENKNDLDDEISEEIVGLFA
jgi:hypothetical protein